MIQINSLKKVFLSIKSKTYIIFNLSESKLFPSPNFRIYCRIDVNEIIQNNRLKGNEDKSFSI